MGQGRPTGRSGIVLTGGYRPGAGRPRRDPRRRPVRHARPRGHLPVASELHDLLVKTHPADAGKIAEIKALVWEYLFIDRVLEVAREARFD